MECCGITSFICTTSTSFWSVKDQNSQTDSKQTMQWFVETFLPPLCWIVRNDSIYYHDLTCLSLHNRKLSAGNAVEPFLQHKQMDLILMVSSIQLLWLDVPRFVCRWGCYGLFVTLEFIALAEYVIWFSSVGKRELCWWHAIRRLSRPTAR